MTESLVKEFENVMILDCATDFKSLNQKEQNKIAKFNNPMEWYKIRNSKYRNSFGDNKIIYYKLINKVDNNIKNQLSKIIFDKLELIKKGAISPPKEIVKKGADSQLYNRGICTYNEMKVDEVKTPTKNTFCKVTGFTISMQKDNSILLSHTGLKHYYDTDRNTFEQLKRKYLSKVWYNSSFELQIKEMAHNITTGATSK